MWFGLGEKHPYFMKFPCVCVFVFTNRIKSLKKKSRNTVFKQSKGFAVYDLDLVRHVLDGEDQQDYYPVCVCWFLVCLLLFSQIE